jgi:hypothetical protein
MCRLLFFALLLVCLGVIKTAAQATFNTCDSVNINNINARILVHGDMSWDPVHGVAACEFPKGSGKHINFATSLWMSGFDGGGQLHIAAQTYRQTGNDYWPGPLTSDTLTYATSQSWAKIWKVDRNDIFYFLSLSTHTTANTPNAILTWPAKANVNATGNAGAPLTITTDMAPFVDLNGNGIYEPLSGDYPDIKGDQALWWVFSDNGPAHSVTHGRPMGVEVQSMAYAYNRGTLIDNVVYYDYKVINRSPNSYSGTRFGLWDDMGLGYYFDDFIGYDSMHRMGVTYNGTNDDGGSAGHPPNSYGTHIPVAGMTMVVAPGDVGTTYVPAGSFINYQDPFSTTGEPTVDTQFNNYLHAKQANGAHYIHDTTGDFSVPPSGPDCDFVFTGDPSDTTQWSECSGHDIPGDRRFMLTTGDFNLAAGGSQHLVLALVTTNPDTLNGCGRVNFDSIRIVADTAWAIYQNPLPPNAVKNIELTESISIYPNPATTQLTIFAGENITGISINNLLGQTVYKSRYNSLQVQVDVSNLPTGVYFVKINGLDVRKFVKQ